MIQRYCVTLRYEYKVYVDAQSKRDALDSAMGNELDTDNLILIEPKLVDVETMGYVDRRSNELMKKTERRLNIDV